MPLGIYLPVLHLVQQNSKWAVKTESWKNVKLPKFTSKIAGNKDSQKVVNYRRNFKVLQNGRHFCKALVQSQFLLIPVICFISGYYLEGKFEHLGFIHLPTSFKHDTVSFYSLTISYLSMIFFSYFILFCVLKNVTLLTQMWPSELVIVSLMCILIISFLFAIFWLLLTTIHLYSI